MELVNNNSSIDIIIGPMFSGKTTELIRRLSISSEAGYKVLYINSVLDVRGKGVFSTHNDTLSTTIKIDMMKTKNLEDLITQCNSYDVIGIDEAQFFKDLKFFCIQVAEGYGKKVIVSGLNGDFERNPFGEINDLITHCDTITKLNSFCRLCCKKGVMNPGLFSKRMDINSKEQVVVGDKDLYIPVCRKCFKD